VNAPRRLVILAPNWLGDAVMALPLIADIRRAWPTTHLTVAGRGSVAALFGMSDHVTAIEVLEGAGGLGAIAAASKNARALARGAFDAALLLPNSFLSAWVAARAGIDERWGFRADWRGRLLTRSAERPPKDVHQAEYYQALGSALGVATGPPYAHLAVDDASRESARALLANAGVTDGMPFVVLAPGAAYGRAKQWLPERFAELARLIADNRGFPSVLVGARADQSTCREIAAAAPRAIDLSGRTTLATLAGVLSLSQAVVSNDSGAMHLAASVGARVVALFGATNEKKTAPLRAGEDAPTPVVVSTNVWCRPCMLRECPIDHRCMSEISAHAVLQHI
jgi:heptosyltransferase-2